MDKIEFQSREFRQPTKIAIEASDEVVRQHGLDWRTGEQFDHIDGVVRIEVTDKIVTIHTVRTVEAWQRGVPNAGRAVWEFSRTSLASIWA